MLLATRDATKLIATLRQKVKPFKVGIVKIRRDSGGAHKEGRGAGGGGRGANDLRPQENVLWPYP